MLKSRKILWQGLALYLLALLVTLTHFVRFYHFGEDVKEGIVDEENPEFYDALPGNVIATDSMDMDDFIDRLSKQQSSSVGIQAGPLQVKRSISYFTAGANGAAPDTNYFMVLHPYRLSIDDEYFRKGDYNYYKSTVWDSMKNGSWRGHVEVKQIGIGYEAGDTTATGKLNNAPGSILIPISRVQYQVTKVSTIVLAILTIVGSIYYIIILPSIILLRISSNDIFHKTIVPGLNSIGIFLIGLWVLNSVVPIFLHWIFSGWIPSGFIFPYYDALKDRKFLLVSGLVVFIIAKAFQRGYELEKELAAKIKFDDEG